MDVSREKVAKIFALYSSVNKEMVWLEQRGNFGIAIGNDEKSRRWQSIAMRREILISFLMNKNPNWYFAHWISNEEAQRRNDSYNLTMTEQSK